MTPRDWWTRRLLAAAGVWGDGTVRPADIESKLTRLVAIREWLWSHAYPRLLMGSFRYEAREADGRSYDEKAREGDALTYGQRMAQKIQIYNETGNQEMLVDIQNYVWLELLQPTHPNPHFESTERHE